MDPSQASSATIRGDPMKRAVRTDKAPPPLPFFSQAIVCQGMVYCSGSIGMSPITKQMVDGGVGDRTAQALNNLSAVLEEAGSSMRNVVKCNVFLSDMTNFAAMNRVYDTFFEQPKPCRTCVAVKELPMKTDVEIECIAHLSTKAKQLTESGKSPPKVTKKLKKSEAPSRSYRCDLHPRDPSGLSGRQRETSPRRARNPFIGRKKNDCLNSTPAVKRGIDGGMEDWLWKASEDTTRHGLHSSMRKQTTPGVSVFGRSNQDNPADLRNLQLQEEHNGIHSKKRPPPPLKLFDELREIPDAFFDQRNIEEILANTDPRILWEYRYSYDSLRDDAWEWAKNFFHCETLAPLDLIDLATTRPELMEYINSTTSSPQLADWETLLNKRRAEVVYAILGKVLDVHVFGEEMFGPTADQKRMLRSSDMSTRDDDGFTRQKSRASTINSLLTRPHSLPPDFLSSLQTLQGQLTSLLTPLLPPLDDHKYQYPDFHPFAYQLLALLLSAANLALAIRRNANEIYYFVTAPSPSSDFDDGEMNALNAKDIEVVSDVEDVEPFMGSGKIRHIASITGWPACVVYRPVLGDNDEEKTGVRTEVIAKADVYVSLEAVHAKAGEASEGRSGRKTLRGEMWYRSKLLEDEAEIERLKVKRKMDVAGAVMAVAVIGGYCIDKAGGREFLRRVWEMVWEQGERGLEIYAALGRKLGGWEEGSRGLCWARGWDESVVRDPLMVLKKLAYGQD
ncbi:MAG: hypothetical protein Q9213_006527 [Squamulea squamosa]